MGRTWGQLRGSAFRGSYVRNLAMHKPGGDGGANSRNRLTKGCAAPLGSASVLGGRCGGRHVERSAVRFTPHLDRAARTLRQQHRAVGQLADRLWCCVHEPAPASDLRDVALPIRWMRAVLHALRVPHVAGFLACSIRVASSRANGSTSPSGEMSAGAAALSWSVMSLSSANRQRGAPATTVRPKAPRKRCDGSRQQRDARGECLRIERIRLVSAQRFRCPADRVEQCRC